MSAIDIKPLGNGPEIGANCYLVSQNGYQVVLDCGIHPKIEGRAALPDLDALTQMPLAALVSHGHIDHCGALPVLLRNYPALECYATKPTVSIMDRMLHNSVSVMGTIALERGILEYPLYTHGEVDHLVRRCSGMPYREEFQISSDAPISVTFYHSGHVLGSASILLRMPGHTVYYSGDICLTPQELMAGLAPLDDDIHVDTLVVESTRGAFEGPRATSFDAETARFARETAVVLKRGGVVLVPSFALGRSQELLNVIARLMRMGKIPEVPVYASGLGRAIYEIYSKFPDYLKPGANLRPLQEFHRIGDVWERKVRQELTKHPCIIVATSGMMVENTPSAILAQELVREERHGIFFVGYLDPDTLGYSLCIAKSGDELTFELGGNPVKIRIENRQRFDFSAHAHREDLCWYIRKVNPSHVVFIHGDDDAIQWMYDHAEGSFDKHIPKAGESLVLDA